MTAIVPFRAANFARELLIRKLEAEVKASKQAPDVVALIRQVHAAHATASRSGVAFIPRKS